MLWSAGVPSAGDGGQNRLYSELFSGRFFVLRLELHVDGPEEGEPQSPIPLSAWGAFARVLEEELSSLCPEIARYGTVELSVSLMGADAIRSVNRDYRERDEATDVLSFPLWEEDGRFAPDGAMAELLPLGDILICPEETARLHGDLSREEAFCLVLAHGFLHLLAWDHDTEERELAMWSRQDAMKTRLLDALRGAL